MLEKGAGMTTVGIRISCGPIRVLRRFKKFR